MFFLGILSIQCKIRHDRFYQLIECWSSFAASYTRMVKLVTWQGLYPWISRSSLPYNLKP